MKKITLLSITILLFALSANAQNFLSDVRADIQTKIQYLNPADVPTGILYDRTLPLSHLTGYGSPSGLAPQVPSEPNSSASHYFLALEDLYYTDYLNRYPNPEIIYNTNRQATVTTINVGVINTDLNIFRDDAVDIGALLVQGADSLFYDNPNSTISPYHTYRNSFVATPLKSKSGFRNISFTLDSTFWKETALYPISQLEIDFDDENGFVTVTKNQTYSIQYSTYGTKQITIKATFSNNSTKTITSDLELIHIPTGTIQSTSTTTTPPSCYMPTSLTFSSSPYSFQGYDESQAYAGIGKYKNHSFTECISKPVIVIEGYDPTDSFNNDDLFGNSFLNQNGLSSDLLSSSYDVFTLNFEPRYINGDIRVGGSDYLERNAMVLVRMITYLNQNKDTNAEPTKIVGFSMGGVIARYALRYMELNNIPHDVDLYVSVDAPHQGATVPRGAQEMVDFVDDVVPEWLSEEFSQVGENLENPAVRQLLSNHYSSSTFHDTFYNNLNTMGYPQNSRNIAVVNGSFNGNGTNAINQKYFEGKAHLLWVLINGKIRLKFTGNNGNARVFYWRLKVLGVTVSKRERYAYTDPNVGSLENAPGGIATLEMLDDDILKLTELGFDWFVAGMSLHLATDEFSFIPTKSALDYQGNPYLYGDINSNLVCSGNTPFDSYYSAPSTNEPHTFLSSFSSTYIFEEIEGNPQNPNPGGTGTYPHGGTYKVFPPNGGEYPLQTGGGSNILPGEFDPNSLPIPQKVLVWPDMPIGGSNPFWTLYSDPDNALDSWTSTNSTLQFYFLPNKFDADINFQFNITDECGNPQYTPVKFTIIEYGGRPQQENDFIIYPIPADDIITISSIDDKVSPVSAVLYDMFGQDLLITHFENKDTLTINVENLKEGIYIIRIFNYNGNIISKHINIQR